MQLKPYAFLSAALLCIPLSVGAAPWIKPDNIEARHHIELLSAAGVLSTPITQWPVMWRSIGPDLKAALHKKLSARERESVLLLLGEYNAARKPVHGSATLRYADQERTVLGGFGHGNQAPSYAEVSAGFTSGSWAGELKVGYAITKEAEEHRRLDGSYLATALGNWAFSVGAVDKWWGPGWQNSMILSDNARPVPGINVQRVNTAPFDTPLLSWLGPWQFSAFIGQLESDRAVPEAKLLGMRVAFKPVHWLEVGLSRTAQWGGEGRPENLDTFSDLLIGRDNRGDNSVTIDNEPGNQLGGVDIKVSHSVPWGSLGTYLNAIGEDEAGGAPSRYVYTAGFDGTIAAQAGTLRWFTEYTDSAAGALDDEYHFNYAYEHGIYQTGYRYKGRPLGASIDSDSRMTTLGLHWYMNDGNAWRLRWSEVDLNRDGGRITGFSGKGSVAQLSYHWRTHAWAIDAGYRWQDDKIQIRGLPDGVSTPFLSLTRHW